MACVALTFCYAAFYSSVAEALTHSFTHRAAISVCLSVRPSACLCLPVRLCLYICLSQRWRVVLRAVRTVQSMIRMLLAKRLAKRMRIYNAATLLQVQLHAFSCA